jgi:hypothetical protein
MYTGGSDNHFGNLIDQAANSFLVNSECGSDNHFGNLIDQAANSFLVNSEYARIIPYPDQRISLYHR